MIYLNKKNIFTRLIAMAVVCLVTLNDLSFAVNQTGRAALAPPLATKPPCSITYDPQTGQCDVSTNLDVIKYWNKKNEFFELQGKKFLNRWAFTDVSMLIGQMLEISQKHKIEHPKNILIPLIFKHINARNGMRELVLEGLDIDGIEEIHEDGRVTGFSLPVIKNGIPISRLIYSLNGGDTVMPLRNGVNVFITSEPILKNIMHSSQIIEPEPTPDSSVRGAEVKSNKAVCSSIVDMGDYKQIFISGSPSLGATLEEQSANLLSLIDKTLAENGCDRDSIVKQAVFLKSVSDRKKCEDIFRKHYGRAPPATSYIQEPPIDGSLLGIEILAIPKTNSIEIEKINEHLTIVRRKDTRWAYVAGIEADEGIDGTYEQSLNIFLKMQKLLEDNGFTFDQAVRIWICVNNITGKVEGDKQRYQLLNDARKKFFDTGNSGKPIKFANDRPPASTGIGMHDGNIVMECLAIDSKDKGLKIIPIKNPEQTNAYDYSDKVLERGISEKKKAPPLFSRGMAVVSGGLQTILISGTASVKGEKVVYEGDVEKQTETTIENVGLVLSQVGATLKDIPQLRVYIKNPEDHEKVKRIVDAEFPDVPCLYVHADVCRDGWLVEIEAIAYAEIKDNKQEPRFLSSANWNENAGFGAAAGQKQTRGFKTNPVNLGHDKYLNSERDKPSAPNMAKEDEVQKKPVDERTEQPEKTVADLEKLFFGHTSDDNQFKSRYPRRWTPYMAYRAAVNITRAVELGILPESDFTWDELIQEGILSDWSRHHAAFHFLLNKNILDAEPLAIAKNVKKPLGQLIEKDTQIQQVDTLLKALYVRDKTHTFTVAELRSWAIKDLIYGDWLTQKTLVDLVSYHLALRHPADKATRLSVYELTPLGIKFMEGVGEKISGLVSDDQEPKPAATDMVSSSKRKNKNVKTEGDDTNPFILQHIYEGKAIEIDDTGNKVKIIRIGGNRVNDDMRQMSIEQHFISNKTFDKIRRAKEETMLKSIIEKNKHLNDLTKPEQGKLIEIVQNTPLSMILGQVVIGKKEKSSIFAHVRTGYSKYMHRLGPTIWIGEVLFNRLSDEMLAQFLLEEAQHILRPPKLEGGIWINMDAPAKGTKHPERYVNHNREFIKTIDVKPGTGKEIADTAESEVSRVANAYDAFRLTSPMAAYEGILEAVLFARANIDVILDDEEMMKALNRLSGDISHETARKGLISARQYLLDCLTKWRFYGIEGPVWAGGIDHEVFAADDRIYLSIELVDPKHTPFMPGELAFTLFNAVVRETVKSQEFAELLSGVVFFKHYSLEEQREITEKLGIPDKHAKKKKKTRNTAGKQKNSAPNMVKNEKMLEKNISIEQLTRKYGPRIHFGTGKETRKVQLGSDTFLKYSSGSSGDILAEAGAIHCNFVVIYDKSKRKAVLMHTNMDRPIKGLAKFIKKICTESGIDTEDKDYVRNNIRALIATPKGDVSKDILTDNKAASLTGGLLKDICDSLEIPSVTDINSLWYWNDVRFFVEEGVLAAFNRKHDEMLHEVSMVSDDTFSNHLQEKASAPNMAKEDEEDESSNSGLDIKYMEPELPVEPIVEGLEPIDKAIAYYRYVKRLLFSISHIKCGYDIWIEGSKGSLGWQDWIMHAAGEQGLAPLNVYLSPGQRKNYHKNLEKILVNFTYLQQYVYMLQGISMCVPEHEISFWDRKNQGSKKNKLNPSEAHFFFIDKLFVSHPHKTENFEFYKSSVQTLVKAMSNLEQAIEALAPGVSDSTDTKQSGVRDGSVINDSSTILFERRISIDTNNDDVFGGFVSRACKSFIDMIWELNEKGYLSDEDLMLPVNAGGLHNCLNEILINAMQSIEKQWKSEDYTGCEFIARAVKTGGNVIIELLDNGTGIKEDILAKIGKEAFSSTGKANRGIGLLNISKSASDIGWKLIVKNRTDVPHGARVAISIPVTSEDNGAGSGTQADPKQNSIQEQAVKNKNGRTWVNARLIDRCVRDACAEAVKGNEQKDKTMFFNAFLFGSAFYLASDDGWVPLDLIGDIDIYFSIKILKGAKHKSVSDPFLGKLSDILNSFDGIDMHIGTEPQQKIEMKINGKEVRVEYFPELDFFEEKAKPNAEMAALPLRLFDNEDLSTLDPNTLDHSQALTLIKYYLEAELFAGNYDVYRKYRDRLFALAFTDSAKLKALLNEIIDSGRVEHLYQQCTQEIDITDKIARFRLDEEPAYMVKIPAITNTDGIGDSSVSNQSPLEKDEQIHTVNFQDSVKYIQAKESDRAEVANEEARPLIVALGTSWVKGYRRGECKQFDALNPLITALRNSRKYTGAEFIIEEDDALLGEITAQMKEKGFENARVIALAGENTVRNALADLNDGTNVLMGVDNTNLDDMGYVRIMEMLTIAARLMIDPEAVPNSPNILIEKRGGFWIFIPDEKPMDYERLKDIYEVQRSA